MKKHSSYSLSTLLVFSLCILPSYAQTWTNVGSLWSSHVKTFTEFNSKLYIGGNFTSENSTTCTFMASWNGSSVQTTNDSELGGTGFVCLEEHNGVLYGGGTSTTNSGGAMALQWDGSSWGNSSMALNTNVYAMKSFGGYLWIGGLFTSAQGVTCNHIVKWDDEASEYTAAANGFDQAVSCFAVYNNSLYAAGGFSNSGSTPLSYVAKWNGSDWEALSTGVNGNVTQMVVYKNELYLLGDFTMAGTTSITGGIAKWNGTTWSAVGTGLTLGPNGARAMTADENYLYVGGDLSQAGGVAVQNVAKWDGSAWSTVGDGLSGELVNALYSWNGYLYAGLYKVANTNLVRQCLIQVTTGIDDATEEHAFAQVYYNNDQSTLVVNLNEIQPYNVEIKVNAINGIEALASKLDQTKNEILFKAKPGLYIATIISEVRTKQVKFLVR